MEKQVIAVEGMSCPHCKKSVEQALMTLDGVKGAEVSLEQKSVEIEYDPNVVTLDKLKQKIEDAGYDVG